MTKQETANTSCQKEILSIYWGEANAMGIVKKKRNTFSTVVINSLCLGDTLNVTRS